MVTYFKSQKDLAYALIEVIDGYWANEITEDNMINRVNDLISKNTEIIYQSDDFSSIVKQRLGKKRLALLTKVNQNTGDV